MRWTENASPLRINLMVAATMKRLHCVLRAAVQLICVCVQKCSTVRDEKNAELHNWLNEVSEMLFAGAGCIMNNHERGQCSR